MHECEGEGFHTPFYRRATSLSFHNTWTWTPYESWNATRHCWQKMNKCACLYVHAYAWALCIYSILYNLYLCPQLLFIWIWINETCFSRSFKRESRPCKKPNVFRIRDFVCYSCSPGRKYPVMSQSVVIRRFLLIWGWGWVGEGEGRRERQEFGWGPHNKA